MELAACLPAIQTFGGHWMWTVAVPMETDRTEPLVSSPLLRLRPDEMETAASFEPTMLPSVLRESSFSLVSA